MFKLIKNIVRLSTLVVVLNIGLANAAQSPEYISIHGTACQPVNLNQAFNFNITWTKNGVFNPNPLGSNKFFFVACPVVITDDLTPTPNSDATVLLYYQDRNTDPTTRTFCFVQRQDHLNPFPGGVRTVSSTDSNLATGPGLVRLNLNDIIQDTDNNYFGIEEALVVVCKLYPQAGIFGVGIDHD